MKLFTAPTHEPVTLTEAKDHLRVDHAADDAWIGECIVAARQWCEQYCGRTFITSTWDWYLDALGDTLEIPMPPTQSVTSITYMDSNGDSQVLSTALYRVDVISQPARITSAYGEIWPSTYDVINSVTVRVVAGYGGAAQVPSSIRHAILIMVGELYENREDSIALTINSVPFGVRALLAPYRISLL